MKNFLDADKTNLCKLVLGNMRTAAKAIRGGMYNKTTDINSSQYFLMNG